MKKLTAPLPLTVRIRKEREKRRLRMQQKKIRWRDAREERKRMMEQSREREEREAARIRAIKRSITNSGIHAETGDLIFVNHDMSKYGEEQWQASEAHNEWWAQHRWGTVIGPAQGHCAEDFVDVLSFDGKVRVVCRWDFVIVEYSK